jgi:hypothetical protein
MFERVPPGPAMPHGKLQPATRNAQLAFTWSPGSNPTVPIRSFIIIIIIKLPDQAIASMLR